MKGALILAVLAVSTAVLAQPAKVSLSTTTTATVNSQKTEKKVQVFTPLTARPRAKTNKIQRVDGMSSQPWSRMIGRRPGWSAFPTQERQIGGMNLFWVGAAPSQQR